MRLTEVPRYAILDAQQYRAASSMAEHPTLNRQVQGSSPWQPTPISLYRASTMDALLIRISLHFTFLVKLFPKWYCINKDFINYCLYNGYVVIDGRMA